jgi:hypothetical protein
LDIDDAIYYLGETKKFRVDSTHDKGAEKTLVGAREPAEELEIQAPLETDLVSILEERGNNSRMKQSTSCLEHQGNVQSEFLFCNPRQSNTVG